jgi:TonB family protein
MLALVFTVQLALIFWLGARGPVYAGRPAAVPTLRIAGSALDELLALNDPTLFALPHQQGFAGPAWLTVTNFGADPFVWSEPSRWLQLPLEELGAVFRNYIATNQFNPPAAPSRLEPEFVAPEVSSAFDLPQQSALRLTGGLAELPLSPHIILTSRTNSDILTNSVVQVLVGGDGRPVSVTLLSGSGSKEADQTALQTAVQAHFQLPAIGSGAPEGRLRALTWGQMIFEWHTLPPPSTNQSPNP